MWKILSSWESSREMKNMQTFYQIAYYTVFKLIFHFIHDLSDVWGRGVVNKLHAKTIQGMGPTYFKEKAFACFNFAD